MVKIEKYEYAGWKIVCAYPTAGRMYRTTEVGPRIIRFASSRRRNELYEQEDDLGNGGDTWRFSAVTPAGTPGGSGFERISRIIHLRGHPAG